MLYEFIDYLDGRAPTADDVLKFYYEQFGDFQEEWTREQKTNVRKAVVKALANTDHRGRANPDEIVEYLWAAGWEYRAFKNTVIGVERYVENWCERMFPKDMMELAQNESNDPILLETVEILRRFRLEPTPRECRMILREGLDPKWIQYACELHRSWGTQINNWTVKVALETAREKFNKRNERYVFDF